VTISYPLSLPSTRFAAISLRAVDVVGSGQSPFTLSEQFQRHAGQRWEADIQIPPMLRAEAEEWIAFLLSLKGRWGTFLLRDSVSGTPRGTWAGSPVVSGSHAAGAETLNLKSFSAAATVKKGDYLSLGSGASTRLHKALGDVTADGSGNAALDIWPALREALSDGAAVTSTNALGTFRLASNTRSWDIATAQIFGLRFTAVEAL